MVSDAEDCRRYLVSQRDKEPLLRFLLDALRACGCRILRASSPAEAPFRITFETEEGERLGVVAYAFLANQRETKNRPSDEHRFQVKYGTKDGELHEVWQDPYALYTTLFLGINPERRFFVGADPVLHNPTRMFISIEFKERNVGSILSDGWAVWERDRRSTDDRPVEVLVGGRPESFLRYVRFERDALAEDQGHRQLLAERGVHRTITPGPEQRIVTLPTERRLHQLVREFQLSETEVLDLIERAPRLRMAVRGWVAEEHLFRSLRRVSGVDACERITREGGADIALRYLGVPLTVECKNVLRKMTAAGLPRLDFQRTRISKHDPCSRYYGADDFDVVAACLHAVTERWDFRFVRPCHLDAHKKCLSKLSNNVRVDERWKQDPAVVLREAAA